MAPHGYSGLVAVHRFRRDAEGRAFSVDLGQRDLLMDNTRDYVMWNVVTS